MRLPTMRISNRVTLPLVVLLTAVGGCKCDTPVDECKDVAVKFTAPVDMANVNTTLDVVAAATTLDGTAPVEIDAASLSSDVSGSLSTTPTLGDANATFSGVKLTAGKHVLTATVQKKGTTCMASTSITVTAKGTTLPDAKVTMISLPQDTNADGTLNATELPPGTEVQLLVKTENANGFTVNVRQGTILQGGPSTVANEQVLVTMPQVGEADGSYDLFAEISNNGAILNTATGNPAALFNVKVNRAAVACANSTRVIFGPSDDADLSKSLFQLTATGTVGASVVSAKFKIMGVGESADATPVTGMVAGTIDVPATGETAYDVVLEAKDAAGNLCRDTRRVTVDLVAPAIAVQSPTVPDSGVVTATVTPLVVNLAVTGADGQSVCASRQSGSGAPMQVACTVVIGGVATLNVPFSQDGQYALSFEVRDAAGNVGTAGFNVTAALTNCGVAFTAPSTCPAFITASQISAGNFTFRAASANCANGPFHLKLDGVAVGTANTTGVFVAMVTPGTHTARVEVDNTVGAPSFVECEYEVNLSAAQINVPSVLTGSTKAVVNAAGDLQPSVPGIQGYIQFAGSIPTTGKASLCATQQNGLSGARPACPDGASGWYLLADNIHSSDVISYTEGDYSIRLVITGGGSTMASPDVPLLVDGTLPCLTGLSLPQDLNSDSKLNIAELGTAADGGATAPKLSFTLGCGDTSFAANSESLQTITGVTVRNVNGTVVGSTTFNTTAGVSATGTHIDVNLTDNVAAESDYRFFVELKDSARNTNVYSGIADVAAKSVRIDRVIPSCTISSPSSSLGRPLGIADLSSGTLSVGITTSSDVNTVSATLGTTTRTGSASGGTGTVTFSLTGTTTQQLAATCTDAAGNSSATTPRSLTVDLDAPTCSISSPVTGMTYTLNPVQTTVAVGGADGQPLTIKSSTRTGILETVDVLSGAVNTGVTYDNGTQTITVEVADTAGNVCTASVANVNVGATNCTLNLTNVYANGSSYWLNKANTGATGTSVSAMISATSPNCLTNSVTLTKIAPGSPVVVNTANAIAGAVAFATTVTSGEEYTISIDNGMGVLTTKHLGVDLVAPVASPGSVSSGAPLPSGQLSFVAATGNHNADTHTSGYFVDSDANVSGAQISFSVDPLPSLAAMFNGANANGKIEVRLDSALVGSTTVAASATTAALANLTFAQNATGTLAVRLIDQAGNASDASSNPLRVDVVAPGTPTVTARTIAASRTASIDVTWTAVFDDGTASTSGAADVDLRWVTSSVPTANMLATEADFFGTAANRVTGLSGLTTTRLTLPPFNKYAIAVRGVDEVGNYSANYAAPPALDNSGTRVDLLGVATSQFGQNLQVASLNNDSINDLVVGASSEAGGGAVYIYYGGGAWTTSGATSCDAGCQKLVPPDGQTGFFGNDVSTAGNVTNLGTERKNDLLIAQNRFATVPNSPEGRVLLYFGDNATTIPTNNFIEFRGATQSTGFGFVAQIISDIDGDQLDEVAIAEVNGLGGRGRVFIFKGRSLANWLTARSAMGIDNVPYVPTSAANWEIDGPTTIASGNNIFGAYRFALKSMQDLDGDGRRDLLIPASKDETNLNRLWVFGSQTIAAATMPLALTSASFQIQSPAATSNSLLTTGFGCSAVTGTDVMGSSAADLVIGNSKQSRVSIFSGVTATGAGSSFDITGPSGFGKAISAGDLNDDGKTDLVISEEINGATPIGAWVLYQQAGAFDANLLTAPNTSQFRGALSSESRGRNSIVADVTGDGKPELILSNDTSAAVEIWR